MTRVLTGLFGRLPLGWLQLTHNRARFFAALAGVAFAVLLIFMQLGFLGALQGTALVPYAHMRADALIYAPTTDTLADSDPFPRRRMLQALGVEGVEAAAPLYIGRLEWPLEGGGTLTLQVYGVDPSRRTFSTPQIDGQRGLLRVPDAALIDLATRNAPPGALAAALAGEGPRFETQGRTLTLAGAVTIGAGFDSDGAIIVSTETFLRLFPRRAVGAPNYALLTFAPGADPRATTNALRRTLAPHGDVEVSGRNALARADQSYQTTERPVGVIFGFGVIIGALVGVIIVYQVLASDVADHLAEYATLKAIGLRHTYFLGVVFEEALILASLGYIPGFFGALLLYDVVGGATQLPIEMNLGRAALVFFGALAMCAASGAIATRRLAAADPADLF